MKEQIQQVLHNIAVAKSAGNNSADVCIVAATKTRSIDTIKQLLVNGVNTVGENRVQELLLKYEQIEGLSWHFIGSLQRNKVKYIVDKVDMIQSVDSIELATEIDKRCRLIGKVMPILVEVNIGGEVQKSGVSVNELPQLLSSIITLPNVALRGLMTVMPIDAPISLYAQMKSLFDSTADMLNLVNFDLLSMGMSSDYQVAVRSGANMVRLGRCIFGERYYE
ncbi:MAG: YggS family pyridoxal phosphate-dependent enzyme [Clostridia bacterium]|nr:YggS family pyridoxal phosphate-dependent enzyme [Clostridia bacterium]